MGLSSYKIDAPRAVAALIIGACSVATTVMYFRKTSTRKEKRTVPDGHTVLKLSKQDLIAAKFPPVGTLTFFAGSSACETHIRLAWQTVVQLNPWLAGYFLCDGENSMLVYPTQVTKEQGDKLIYTCPDTIQANLDPSNPDANAALSNKLCIPYGAEAAKIADQRAPLARIVIVPCAKATAGQSKAEFAIFFCTNHVLGGADTHYKLLNMLSSTSTPYAMPFARLQGFNESQCLAIGHDQDWFSSGPFICRMLCILIFGKRPRAVSLAIDSKTVSNRKSDAKASSRSTGIPYISTNDVFCSSFANMIKARILMINVNFRNKLQGISAQQAGNYEVTVPFDKEHYSTPEACRLSLNALVKRASGVQVLPGDDGNSSLQKSQCVAEGYVPSSEVMQESKKQFDSVSLSHGFPGWWGCWHTKYCLVSNWSSFHEGTMEFPGASEVYSIPAGPISLMHAKKTVTFDVAVLYKARKGELGALFFTRTFSRDDYVKNMPVKDAVL